MDALIQQGKFLSNHTYILSVLEPIEADVVSLRYGVLDGQPSTYDRIAGKLNISAKMAQKYDNLALRKLHHPLKIKYLKMYTDETIDMAELDRFKRPNNFGL